MHHVAFPRTHRQMAVNAAAASGLGAGGREKTSKGRAAGEEDGGHGEGHGGDGAKVSIQSESMCDKDVPELILIYCLLVCALQTAEL